MTCIIGIEQDGIVYMGGDSAAIGDLNITTRKDPKVFITGEFLIGFTTSFRMGQILMFSLNVPEQTSRQSDYEYMVTTFIDAVRDCLEKAGFKENVNGQETGGTFLIGYRGHLYEIEDDFQVGILADGYSAVGCGSDIAKGALFACSQLGCTNAELLINIGLKAAATYSAGVRGPFLQLSL